jgi:hypothetical protein
LRRGSVGYRGGLNDVPLLSLLNKKLKKPVRTMVGAFGVGGLDGQLPPKILPGIEVKPYPSKDLELLLAPRFLDIPTVLSSLSTSDAKMKREM